MTKRDTAASATVMVTATPSETASEPGPNSSLNVYQRINAVRREVSYVKKDARVESYMAVTHDAVTRLIRNHMIEHGVIIIPTLVSSVTEDSGNVTRRGTKILLYRGTFDVAFVNENRPEDRIVIRVEGHANDQGDKAPGKALSIATKNAALKILMIESGENDEAREEMTPAPVLAPDGSEVPTLETALKSCSTSIETIKEAIATGDLSRGSEAWFELSAGEKMALWTAPTKGGPFSTDERKVIHSTEFREAHTGDII